MVTDAFGMSEDDIVEVKIPGSDISVQLTLGSEDWELAIRFDDRLFLLGTFPGLFDGYPKMKAVVGDLMVEGAADSSYFTGTPVEEFLQSAKEA
jgi:hypothetical protein